MNHRRTYFLLVLILLLSLGGYSQRRGRDFTLRVDSEIFGYRWEVRIGLPLGYNPEKAYPVSVILDAESLYESHVGVVDFLAERNAIPEMIVVGVQSGAYRMQLLTHVADPAAREGTTGEGDLFARVLLEEILPKVDSAYSTLPYRVLTGHSMAGLFATRLFLEEQGNFKGFILLDPSVWWQDMEVLDRLEEALGNGVGAGKRMFLAQANSLPDGMDDLQVALEDTTNGTLGLRSVFALEKLLRDKAPEGLDWQSHYYPEERHGWVPLPGTYDGMKHLFAFYQRPSMQVIHDSTHLILERHYQNVSKEMGTYVPPPQRDLAGLSWRLMELENAPERAWPFVQMLLKYHPESASTFSTAGQYYQKIGEHKKASRYFNKLESTMPKKL